MAISQMQMDVRGNGTIIGTYRPMETSINLNKPGIGNISYHSQPQAILRMPFLCDYKMYDGSCPVYTVSINLTEKKNTKSHAAFWRYIECNICCCMSALLAYIWAFLDSLHSKRYGWYLHKGTGCHLVARQHFCIYCIHIILNLPL